MVRRSRKGFTLVELLIALALSMVGLLGLLSLQMMAIRGNATSRNFAEATALAQEKLEELTTVPYANLVAGAVNDPNNPLGANPGSVAKPYTRTWTINDNGSQKTITVEVSFVDEAKPPPNTRTITLRYLRSL